MSKKENSNVQNVQKGSDVQTTANEIKESRSEKLQKVVSGIIPDSEFAEFIKPNSVSAISSDSDVQSLTEKLEKATLAAIYADSVSAKDNSRIVERLARPFFMRKGAKWDNAKSEWNAKGKAMIQNLTGIAFNEKHEPLKGTIRGGHVQKVERIYLDSNARAASWLAWLEDSYKTLTDNTKKASQSRTDKVYAYVCKAHNFMLVSSEPSLMKLSAACKRAAKVYKVTESSVRKLFANEIIKWRTVNKAMHAKDNEKKSEK